MGIRRACLPALDDRYKRNARLREYTLTSMKQLLASVPSWRSSTQIHVRQHCQTDPIQGIA